MDLNQQALRDLGTIRYMGMMRIKNESEWIRASIDSQLSICQKVLVLDDHSTDNTRDIVRLFGDRAVLIESPFEGVNEGRDKRFLLAHAIAANPEWVLWIDGDEVLERNAAHFIVREFANPGASSYAMRILYFWDSLTKIRVDGVYRRFQRASAFRIQGQDPAKLHFPTTGGEADLHCGGNCPQGLNGKLYVSGAQIKHYGYLHADQRQRKYEWYNRIDPNNEAEDCYRHIIETPGARHAPGPTVLEDFQEL